MKEKNVKHTLYIEKSKMEKKITIYEKRWVYLTFKQMS